MSYGPGKAARALGLLAKGTASFDLRASLGQHLLAVLKEDGAEGVAALLADLPGYEFSKAEAGASPGEHSFRTTHERNPRLVVETFLTPGIASVSVSVDSGSFSREEQDPRHRAFYEVWEDFLTGPERPVDSLDPWSKAVLLIGLLESEVMNGGLGQYLANTDGAFLAGTLQCLEEIGASRTAEILRNAQQIGDAAESYVAAWETESAAFEDLDEDFLSSVEDLAALAADRFFTSDSGNGYTTRTTD
jgi:hypothetical protein